MRGGQGGSVVVGMIMTIPDRRTDTFDAMRIPMATQAAKAKAIVTMGMLINSLRERAATRLPASRMSCGRRWGGTEVRGTQGGRAERV